MSGRAPRIAAVVVTAALLAGAAPAAAEPDWTRALRIRSEALNRIYGLGGERSDQVASTRGLQIRSEALNRMYGQKEESDDSQ